jgi:hypothetical protein
MRPPTTKAGGVLPTMAPGSQFSFKPKSSFTHGSLSSPSKPFPLTRKTFDLTGQSSKRQKPNAWHHEDGASLPIEVDASSASRGNARLSSTITSNHSQSRTGQSRSSSGILGTESQIAIDDRMNPNRPRVRKRDRHPSESRPVHENGPPKFITPKDITPTLLDDGDPIMDGRNEQSEQYYVSKPVKRPLDEVRPIARKGLALNYRGSANLEPSRSKTNGAAPPTSVEKDEEDLTISKHFPHKRSNPLLQFQPTGKISKKRTRTQAADTLLDQSFDDLSADQYGETTAREEANHLLQKAQGSQNTSAEQKSKSSSIASVYSMDSSDEDTANMKANITTTDFSQKRKGKPTGPPREAFEVKQVFSNIASWLDASMGLKWELRRIGDEMMFLDEKTYAIPELSFSLKIVTSIRRGRDSGKLFLLTSKDLSNSISNSVKRATIVCIEFCRKNDCDEFLDGIRALNSVIAVMIGVKDS